MAWGFDATTWAIRVPIVIPAAVAAGTAVLASVDMPSDFSLFWDHVDSNGYYVDFADANGTALTWDRSNWDHANRLATLRVQYTTPTGSGTGDIHIVYMFLTKSGAGDGGGDNAGTPAGTAKTGYVPPAMEFPKQGFAPITGDMLRDDDGTWRPGDKLTILKDATHAVLLVMGAVFMQNAPGHSYNGKDESEAPQWFTWDVINDAGTSQTGWFTAADARCVAGAAGDVGALALYLPIEPDAAASNRLKVEITTNESRTLQRWVHLTAVEPSIA